MSRVIKFRGWDATGQKGWVYGDLVHNQKVTKEGLEPRVMVGGYEVVPESVGQFTGLNDKNGKEIFEGDIVVVYDFTSVYASKYQGVVRMYKCGWVVEYEDKTFGIIAHPKLCFDDFADRKTEIIGTIYEQNKK